MLNRLHPLQRNHVRSRNWHVLPVLGVLLALLLSATYLWQSNVVSAAPWSSDPVTAAWEKAQAAGSYHFTSNVTQKAIPVASISNVGRTSRSEHLYLEGQNDLHAQKLELTLWSQGGSVLNAESGLSIRSEDGKTFARRGGSEWEEIDSITDGFAPQGDFLGYLAAIRNVSEGVVETRNGVRFTRYHFTIDGPAFATYMHKQLLATMRAKGELPPGMELEAPAYYRDMTGNGELWVGEDGLPLRQILDLNFPEQKEERVQAAMTVDFSSFGIPQSGLLTLLRSGDWRGAWLILPSTLPDLKPLWLALILSAGAFFVLVQRRARVVQIALVSAVIFSLVAGPLLSTFTNAKFFDSQTAKAALQEQTQADAADERAVRQAVLAGAEFDPHQNPVGQWDSESVGQSADSPISQSPNLQSLISNLQSVTALAVSDPGTDSDGDTLTDFVELRIGTSEVISDTDGDSINDNIEVRGFPFAGQTWYTNPNVIDSNYDGQSDLAEWGLDNAGNLRSAPFNTDGDSLPDLFDPDNDNDGVSDRKDLAPMTNGAATYSEAAPLQLTINNLTANKPVFVEFQIRPQDAKNLWFAHNLLDWPQDNEAQVRDVDGKTYADVAASQGRATEANEANGDMKLIPMLEIRIPNSSANLPSQAQLTPFNITVNDFTADGTTKVAYVPLSVISDENTGERVAFSGQMRYLSTGSWSSPHSVRLAWVVQTLSDLPCDPKDANAVANGCQVDAAGNGYLYNQLTMVQSYYDNWTLTGLTVSEDHGASMAMIYEDPAVDDNKKDDRALWGLAYVLDNFFVFGHDDNKDGQRDLKLSDLPTRFDRDNNPSPARRFEIPNILQVVTNSYSTLDEMVAATAMTETTKILNNAFKPVVTADNAVKPLLFFAQENSMRALGLDLLAAGDGYATQSGVNLTMNMAPTPQRAMPVVVTAGIRWMAYCGGSATGIQWRPCTSDEYATEFERRYATLPNEPNETKPYLVPGRMILGMMYYSALSAGYYGQVQEGATVIAFRYSLESEDEATTTVRNVFKSLATIPLLAHQLWIRAFMGAQLGTNRTLVAATLDGMMDTFLDPYKKIVSLDPDHLSADDIRAIKNDYVSRFQLKAARLGVAGVVGGIMMLFTQLAAAQTTQTAMPVAARATLGALAVIVTLGVTVGLEVATFTNLYKYKVNAARTSSVPTPKPSLSVALMGSTIGTKVGKICLAVGLAVSLVITWGFFIYGAATSGYAAGSPQLAAAFFEAVAATLVAVLLAVLSVTVIGAIIVTIIAVIDLILTLICELGVNELRSVPGLGGACFNLSTSLIKVLSYLLYNYDPMINTSRSDLMVTGAPDVTLTDPSKGYVSNNTLNLSLPVTTTIVHKDPDPSIGLLINSYIYYFSPENLRSSTFKYGLTTADELSIAVDRDQMFWDWQNVREDHKYQITPMYRGEASTSPAPLNGMPLVQGINSTVPFSLTMNFALPAYECWSILFVIPVCYVREFESKNTIPFTTLKYDVFPPTLAGFLALGSKADGGLGQSWDARFPSLRDADGDGLNSSIYNGLDPNDTLWDSDGDGLSDRFELEQRVAGTPYSPILRDSDGDGLSDPQEANIGTNPAVADTDNDGLRDGDEVRHQRVDANGAPSTTWEGGWRVTINSNAPFDVWVSSDPLNADGDQDGISDQAEKTLAASSNAALQLDNLGRPFNPQVFNTPPLAVFAQSNAQAGFVAPNATLRYTTTVVAYTPVEPGVLDVTIAVGQGIPPLPLGLGFSPLTFSNTQTVTQGLDFRVDTGNDLRPLTLLSTVRTRLQSTGGADWVSDPIALGAPLAGFRAPFNARTTGLTASRADRQDNYLLASLIPNNTNPTSESGGGDLRSFSLPEGTSTLLENSLNNGSSYFLRGATATTLASNTSGNTLAVWDHIDNCNTLTIHWLKVTTAASDPNGGIEPFLTRGATSSQNQIWRWDSGGGTPDMTAGQQRGPNAFAFPITIPFCGDYPLYVWESDSGGVDEAVGNRALNAQTERAGETLVFTGSGHTIQVNVTVPVKDSRILGGAILNANGALQRQISFPRPAVSSDYKLRMRHPIVASNGEGFLVAYEVLTDKRNAAENTLWIATQGFDKDGNPYSNNSAKLTNIAATPDARVAMDSVWLGDHYRVMWKDAIGSTIYTGDYLSSGNSLNSGWTTLVTDAAQSASTTVDYSPQLAYNPTTGRWIMNYIRGTAAEGVVNLYEPSPHALDNRLISSRVIGISRKQSFAAYHPVSRGWLVGWYNAPNIVGYPLKPDLTDLAPLVSGIPPIVMATGSAFAGGSMACPAPQSVAVTDLRFEEIPGATTFADASGRGFNATCAGTACPAPGVLGAPNAALSDSALYFDGTDDGLTLNRPVQDDFSFTFWLKAAGFNRQQMLIDGGAGLPNGFQVWTNNGLLSVNMLGVSGQSAGRIDDNQWHFVAINRNKASGRVEAYVDGVSVIGVTGTANLTLNAAPDLWIGKSRNNSLLPMRATLDHLQIYPIALSQSTVQAIFNRTNQSYCVASGLGTGGANIQWGKISLRQQDARGGRIEASGKLNLIMDGERPTASVTSVTHNKVVGADQVIGGTASDSGSGVAKVEVSINSGPWQLATGLETWSFSLAGVSGDVTIKVRASDRVGNVGDTGSSIQLRIDTTAPVIRIDPLPLPTSKPTKNANGQWQVALTGRADDTPAGTKPGSVRILFVQQSGVGVAQSEQVATLNGSSWNINYLLNASLFDPTGGYTVTVQAEDTIGNRSVPMTGVVRLDASGPIAALNATDTARTVISQTLSIGGVVSDSNSSVGIGLIEIAFTPIEQVLPLPPGSTSSQAEAQLNRVWSEVTLAQRGAGVASTTWSYAIPSTLENVYQIDLRATDMLGNVSINAGVWRGTIDTRKPRLVMNGSASGQSYIDAADNTLKYEITYTCRADDWQLSESSFNCPGNAIQPASRAFNTNPILQSQFPSVTIVSAMSNTWTVWSPSVVPTGTLSACDSVGNCATQNVSVVAGVASAAIESESVSSSQLSVASEQPKAVVINPTAGSFVGSAEMVEVTVAAEAAKTLKEVTVLLDGEAAATIAFARLDKATVAQRSVSLPMSAGEHTLEARASDWAGTMQAVSSPVHFTLVIKEPSVALGKKQLTISDTWSAQSGIMVIRGTVDDTSDNLAAVQVKVGDQAYVDAQFANGNWGVAYPVIDPENRTFSVTVRAIDKAGQITMLGDGVESDLGTAVELETTISSAPPTQSPETNASFSFSGTSGVTELSAFECQLDDGEFTICSSPQSYSELSNGEHTFRVHAINGQGTQDATPASHTWTVKGAGTTVDIDKAPASSTSERTAIFEFKAGGLGDVEVLYECSLDSSAYSSCSSPTTYNDLADGNHVFQVRAKQGSASRHTWHVVNAAPVAQGQTVSTSEGVNLALTLVANDNQRLSYRIVDKPAHGVLQGEIPNLVYQPESGFFGTDSFTFKADDGNAGSNVATVTIHVTPAPGQAGIERGNFVVFAQEGVILRDNVKVMSGDIAASLSSQGPWLGEGAEVVIGYGVTLLDSKSKVLGDSLFVGQGTVLGDVNYNELRGPGTVNGSKVTPQALPLLNRFVSLPAIGVGKQNIDVASAGSASVAAGSYANLNVGDSGTVIFSGGIYSFKEWTVGNNTKVYFSATSEVRVAGRVWVGERGYVGPAPSSTVKASQIVIFVAGVNANIGNLGGLGGKAATFGPYATLAANVTAPNGTLLIRERSKAVGSFVARWVSVGKFSELSLDNRFATTSNSNATASITNVNLHEALLADAETGLQSQSQLSADVDAELTTEEGSNEVDPVVTLPGTVTPDATLNNRVFLPVISSGAVGQSSSETVDGETVDSESVSGLQSPLSEEASKLVFLPLVNR